MSGEQTIPQAGEVWEDLENGDIVLVIASARRRCDVDPSIIDPYEPMPEKFKSSRFGEAVVFLDSEIPITFILEYEMEGGNFRRIT